MNKNDTAIDREKAGKMFELNEKYKDFPERISEYEIDGKKYIVHSRFVGEKNIDETWDSFVSSWKKIGGDEVTAEVNAWYAKQTK